MRGLTENCQKMSKTKEPPRLFTILWNPYSNFLKTHFPHPIRFSARVTFKHERPNYQRK